MEDWFPSIPLFKPMLSNTEWRYKGLSAKGSNDGTVFEQPPQRAKAQFRSENTQKPEKNYGQSLFGRICRLLHHCMRPYSICHIVVFCQGKNQRIQLMKIPLINPGPPKLIKPSFSQNRNASPKDGWVTKTSSGAGLPAEPTAGMSDLETFIRQIPERTMHRPVNFCNHRRLSGNGV